MFGYRRPTYLAFDLLIADGVGLRPLPLRERKAVLARVGKGAERCTKTGAGQGYCKTMLACSMTGPHLAFSVLM